MNTTLDTMKVEKSLMNPDFEGYKLSLENIATFVKKLPESVKPHSPSDEQVNDYKCLNRQNEHHNKYSLIIQCNI